MISVPDVLVVGAGPTGLTLALQAHEHGAAVRIVERRPDASRPSRALLVHARTLEALRPLGVTGALLERAIRSPTACLHLGARTVPVDLSGLDLPGSGFPALTLLSQMGVESVLAEALAGRGIRVERGTELIGAVIDSDGGGARVTLRSAGGEEDLLVRVLAGCDGVDSTVRRLAGIGWPGGCYRREVLLADVDLSGHELPDVLRVAAGRRGVAFLFPLREGAGWRVLATRPARKSSLPPGVDGPRLLLAELQALLDEAGLPVRISRQAWSTRLRLQHRIAGQYRRGPVLLAGDAAHAFSPAGGQGMNTGIQDAANLGWKLGLARSSTDPQGLLDSYQYERRPVAQQTLMLTHVIFWAESSVDPVASLVRGTVVPLAAPLIPALLANRLLTRTAVRMLSGLRVHYRASPLSQGGGSRYGRWLRAGDRLPDRPVTCDGRSGQLHELLAAPGVHLLVERDARPATGAGPWLKVHRLTGSPGTGVLAVRPDGYVGFHAGDAQKAELRRWLGRVGVTAGPEVPFHRLG